MHNCKPYHAIHYSFNWLLLNQALHDKYLVSLCITDLSNYANIMPALWNLLLAVAVHHPFIQLFNASVIAIKNSADMNVILLFYKFLGYIYGIDLAPPVLSHRILTCWKCDLLRLKNLHYVTGIWKWTFVSMKVVMVMPKNWTRSEFSGRHS